MIYSATEKAGVAKAQVSAIQTRADFERTSELVKEGIATRQQFDLAAVVDDKTGFAGMRVEYPPDVARDSNAIEIWTKGRQAFVRLQDTKEKGRAVFALDGDGRTEFRTVDGTGTVIRQMMLSTPER